MPGVILKRQAVSPSPKGGIAMVTYEGLFAFTALLISLIAIVYKIAKK